MANIVFTTHKLVRFSEGVLFFVSSVMACTVYGYKEDFLVNQ